MMRLSIRDFIEAHKEIDRLNRHDLEQINWNDRFRDAGYHNVALNTVVDWNIMHQWCTKTYGNNYCWVGTRFWFDTEQDAVLFTLRWL